MKKKLMFNNTYQSGAVTYLIFKEKDKFVGICLEFDLEIQADTIQEAREYIEDYSQAWLKNVVNNKLSEELLNKPAPKKYWRLYQKVVEEAKERIKVQMQPSLSLPASFPMLDLVSRHQYSPQFPYFHN